MGDDLSDIEAGAARATTMLPREFVEGLSESFLQFDADWLCIDCNAAAVSFLQRPRSQIVGRVLWSFPRISKGSPFAVVCRRVRETQAPEEAEAAFPLRGQRRLLLIQVFPLCGGVGAVWRDITEVRAAERRLAESERHFRALALDMPAAAWASRADGGLTFINQAMVDTLGRSREDLLDQGWLKAVDAEDHDQLMASLREAREAASPFDVEGRFRHADGGLRIVHLHGRPRFDDGRFAGHIGTAEDVTARRRFEQRQALLIGELNHRVKNTLATVQSVVTQTLKEVDAEREAAINGRLMALSAAHDVLTRQAWEGCYLHEIVATAVNPYADANRVEARGPPIWVATSAAVALSMALHELATNATKHGALSVPEGRVVVHWTADDGQGSEVEWREFGGPPIAPPTRAGFGSRLLGRGLAGELGAPADLDYRPEGLVCRFRVHAETPAASWAGVPLPTPPADRRLS